MNKSISFFLFVVGFSLLHAAEPTGRYKTIVDQLNSLHTQYPATTEVFSIGQNDDGVEIYAMRVSTTPKEMDPKKVGEIVVSTHHGNELKAPEFTMHFLAALLKRYHSPELYQGNLGNQEWTVLPVLNISGYNEATYGWPDKKGRNERGVDSNRDYPGPCFNHLTPRLKSVRALMDLLEKRPFAGSVTVHGYAGAMTYPWGVDVGNSQTKDHNAFQQITAKAAQLNGYKVGTSTDIVYPVDGAYEDYAYWKHGIWSLLVELERGIGETGFQQTSDAMAYYFNQLDSTPSIQNQLTSSCMRNLKPDLHDE